jgi:hypothetical protein
MSANPMTASLLFEKPVTDMPLTSGAPFAALTRRNAPGA